MLTTCLRIFGKIALCRRMYVCMYMCMHVCMHVAVAIALPRQLYNLLSLIMVEMGRNPLAKRATPRFARIHG